ncbi:unnamed protein product [Lampetra fluviatilis]
MKEAEMAHLEGLGGTNGEGQECDAIMARRGMNSDRLELVDGHRLLGRGIPRHWAGGGKEPELVEELERGRCAQDGRLRCALPVAGGAVCRGREARAEGAGGAGGGGGAMGPGEPMEPREQREPTEPRKLKEPWGGGRDGKKKMAASQRLVGPFAVDERLAQRGPTEPTEPRGPGATTFHVTSAKLTICASGRTLVPADEIADIRWPPLARQTPGGSDRHDRAELAPRARFNRAVGERCFCHSRQKTRYDVRSRGAFTNVPGSWAASP